MAGEVLKLLTISLAAIVVIAIAFFLKTKDERHTKFTPVKKESNLDLKNMRPIEDFI